MQAADVRWPRSCARVICTVFGLAALSAPALAQEADTGETYSIRDVLDPPRGETSVRYQTLAARKGVQTNVIYAAEIDGLLASGQQEATPVAPKKPPRST